MVKSTAGQKTLLKKTEETALARLARLRLWPSQEARLWVGRFVKLACSDSSIAAVVIMGSIVRPVSYAADVDILYVYENDQLPHDKRPLDADVRAYKQSDVPRLLSEGHEPLSWALRYGLLVCERKGFWTRLRHEWLAKLTLPSADVAEERAAKAAQLHRELRAMGDDEAAHEQLISMLTQQARACLLRAGIYPASRPELPRQLREIGQEQLARRLDDALAQRRAAWYGLPRHP